MVATLVLFPYLKRDATLTSDQRQWRLEEAIGLAMAIGVEVTKADLVPLRDIKPKYLIGEGQVAELQAYIATHNITLVVMNCTVTPLQQRNLEKAWNCKVLDRTGLILEIFGQRARTAEGHLQVELASLLYERSRLVRTWTHLERQRGGLGFVGGPGETQLEADRRMITEKITRLRHRLQKVKRTRNLQRQARQRVPYPVVALVGYTNAGKSTLFNALTQSTVIAEDKLFATLDPTMRLLTLPSGQQVILSDTVGFISDLPTQLVEAFHATLEEVAAADLILHVMDLSSPQLAEQRAAVYKVLDDMEIHYQSQGNIIEVGNKVDQLPLADQEVAGNGRGILPISALNNHNLAILLQKIDSFFHQHKIITNIDIPCTAGKALAWLHQNGEVLNSTLEEQADPAYHLQVRLAAAKLAQFQKHFATDISGLAVNITTSNNTETPNDIPQD